MASGAGTKHSVPEQNAACSAVLSLKTQNCPEKFSAIHFSIHFSKGGLVIIEQERFPHFGTCKLAESELRQKKLVTSVHSLQWVNNS